VTSSEEPPLWSPVREAVRGTTQDLSDIPIRRAVVLLAVPTVLEMSMESLLTIVDIIFVSRLGSNAVATVGLTESMLSPARSSSESPAARLPRACSPRWGRRRRSSPTAGSAYTAQGVAGGLLFRRGTWKTKRLA
jgi:hypothetical protein